jgi:small subunit ribosomal protein S3
MGQKTHPFGFRVGVTEAHKSRWYAPKALFAELLVEDYKIRKYVDKRLNRTPPFAAVSDVHIERTREELTVIVKTARPGLVIGP